MMVKIKREKFHPLEYGVLSVELKPRSQTDDYD